VSDAVNPAPLGALLLEIGEAAPQRGVDLLHQVAPQVGIGLVAARQPFDRRTEERSSGVKRQRSRWSCHPTAGPACCASSIPR
jgi:hypothetical protein